MEKLHNNTNQPNVDPGLIVMRHFKDTEDLRNSRDCPLEAEQGEIIEDVSKDIYEDFLKSGSKSIFLSVSSKKRALETAYLIKNYIQKTHNKNTRVFVNSDDNLIDLDHGDFILPDNYKIGDYYEPFEKAWKIFIIETFKKGNMGYKFGDCIKNSDGSATYPEIEGHFTRLGESNKEVSIRLYRSVVELFRSKKRFDSAQIRPYIITHSLPFSVFRSLTEIARRIKNRSFDFEPGSLMKVVWDIYSSGIIEKSSYGQLSEIPADIINNEKFMILLDKELELLTNS